MNFRETCRRMDGEYTEEAGMLEPDVGGQHLEPHEEVKQWCTFERGDTHLTVFNAPDTFGIRIVDKGEMMDIHDNDVDKKFDGHSMCFHPRYGIRVPEGDYCIRRGPRLSITPHEEHAWETLEESMERHGYLD